MNLQEFAFRLALKHKEKADKEKEQDEQFLQGDTWDPETMGDHPDYDWRMDGRELEDM